MYINLDPPLRFSKAVSNAAVTLSDIFPNGTDDNKFHDFVQLQTLTCSDPFQPTVGMDTTHHRAPEVDDTNPFAALANSDVSPEK